MAYGVTETGFVPKTLTDLKDELQEDFRSRYGASIDVNESSNFGQLIGILSDRFAEAWEVLEAVYGAYDPDQAEGAAQDAVCAITGTIRRPATESTVPMTCTGTPGTVLAAGRVASVEDIGTKFETLADATIAAASAWVNTTAYGLGAYVTNGGNIYACTVAGTSAGSGGPTSEDTAITDGTVTWRFLGNGTGYVVVDAEAQETGPKIASSYTLTVIETPVSGWLSVTNEEDAEQGENEETDAELRLRREDELLGASLSVLDAIRTRIANDVENVTSVIVFQNDTEVTNSDGMPPHSVEALVRGGDDQDIIDKIWEVVAGGITTYGNTPGSVTDPENGGQTYAVNFSRPEEIEIYVIANVVKDPDTFPADGATQIRDAILAAGDLYVGGKDVHSNALKAACFGSTVEVDGLPRYVPIPGVINVTTLYIGTAPAPASEASITIALRELAMFDSARVTVNVSDGTP